MLDFSIRQAQPEDALVIANLVSEARTTAYAGLIPKDRRADFAKVTATSPAAEQFWAKKIQKSLDLPNKYVALVATVQGKVVGFYGAKLLGDQLFIQNLYVSPSFQGQGLGGKFLEQSIGKTPKPQIMLNVLAANQASVAFYQKHGFVIDGKSDKTFYGAERYEMLRKQ